MLRQLKKVSMFVVFKWIGILASFIIIARSDVLGVHQIFGFGLLFALVWCNQSVVLSSVFYAGAELLADFSLNNLIVVACTLCVLLITYFLHMKLGKRIVPYLMCVYGILSQAAFVVLSVIEGVSTLKIVAVIVSGVLFFLACFYFFSAVVTRFGQFVFSPLDRICAGIMLLVLGVGLSSCNFMGFSFLKMLSPFIILVIGWMFSPFSSIISGALLGLGNILSTGSPIMLTPLLVWGFAVSIFKCKNKWLAPIALVACECVFGFAINAYQNYGWLDLVPVILGCGIFLGLPKKWLNILASQFSQSRERIALKNIVNRSRNSLCGRLNKLSGLFSEMDRAFRCMIKGSLTEKQATDLLLGEIKDKVCDSCPERHRCHRSFAEETNLIFANLLKTAIERGKITLLDIPPFLTARCTNLALLVGVVNSMTEKFKDYAGLMGNVDASRLLIAEQLSGVSKVMTSLSKEVSQNISLDFGREQRLLDELSFYNIVAFDIVIYEQSTEVVCVTLMVRTKDEKNKKIPIIVSKILRCSMEIVDADYTTKSNFVLLTLKNKPRYDMVFGVASEKKIASSTSGDSFSIIKIDAGKIMLAICDGMGSGEKAQGASHLAISLVEDFYKAGFDNDIILSSVNKLLSIEREEIFSALDLCVLDLRKGLSDFVKLGAPSGFVKTDDEVIVMSGSALPLGILAEARPDVKKAVIKDGDVIVLISDGVSDAFGNDEDIKREIASCDILNPQTFAEHLLNCAVQKSLQGPADDMTIIVAKIF